MCRVRNPKGRLRREKQNVSTVVTESCPGSPERVSQFPEQLRLDTTDLSDYNGHKKEEDMKTAAVSELKARLSEYLSHVKAGMEVLVTERGKPVARLMPVSRTKNLKESLVLMEKQGLIRLGPGKLPKNFWKTPRPEDPEGLVLKALLEEREAGR